MLLLKPRRECILTDGLLEQAIERLQETSGKIGFAVQARKELNGMDLYARERFFHRVISRKEGVLPPEATDIVRGLFLDDFAFECTDVEEYLECIIEDFSISEGTSAVAPSTKGDSIFRQIRRFGSRAVHMMLSLPQLLSLPDRVGDLRSDVGFAVRVAQLVQAEATMKEETSFHLLDSEREKLEIRQIDQCLMILKTMTPSANVVRFCLLYRFLYLMQYKNDTDKLRTKLLEYLALPRNDVGYANPDHVAASSCNARIVFSKTSNQLGFGSDAAIVEAVAMELRFPKIDSNADITLIKNVLHILWDQNGLRDYHEEEITKYLVDSVFRAEKKIQQVKTGSGNLSDSTIELQRQGVEIKYETEIAFCESNQSYFSPEEDVELFVRVKNVKTLTVHVYEISTIDYYARTRQEIRGDICLDGIFPTEEQQIDLTQVPTWTETRIPIKVATTATGKRGVFVVEAIERSLTCRAIVRKGFLCHVGRVTAHGHEFVVMDERGKALVNAYAMIINTKSGNSTAQPPWVYKPNQDGTIIVPYLSPGMFVGDTFSITFCHEEFGFYCSSFEYLTNAFKLNTQMYIDSEQLRPGEEALLLVRPSLFVEGSSYPLPLDSLNDIVVAVHFSSNVVRGNSIVKKIERKFKTIHEFLAEPFKFMLALDSDELNVAVTARVAATDDDKARSQARHVVTSSKSFRVQRMSQFDSVFTMFLHRRPVQICQSIATTSNFVISVVNHNGDPICFKEIHFRLKQFHFLEPIRFVLQTDDHGEIQLGELHDIEYLSANFVDAGVGVWTWELPNLRSGRPDIINCNAGESVEVTVPHAFASNAPNWMASGLVSAYRVVKVCNNDDPILERVDDGARSSLIRNHDGQVVGISFEADAPGQYVLHIRPLQMKHPIMISGTTASLSWNSQGLLLAAHKILVPTLARRLAIASHTITKNGDKNVLRVKLRNASPDTRVWIICRRSMARRGEQLSAAITTSSLISRKCGELAFETILFKNEYLAQRSISDEHAYILQRRAFVEANPSSLLLHGSTSIPKPTLLQNPIIANESDMERVVQRPAEQVSGFAIDNKREIAQPGASAPESKAGENVFQGDVQSGSISSTSFFQGASVVQLCYRDDCDDTVFSASLSGLASFMDDCAFEIVVLAIDSNCSDVTTREFVVASPKNSTRDFPKKDLRLSSDEVLSPTSRLMQGQRHECLFAGQSRDLSETVFAKYALYDTLETALDLWLALCNDPILPDLVEKLKAWPVLTTSEKVAFYNNHASDDFNFFLNRKDRHFYTEFVAPLVEAKLCKSLIDLHLLGKEEKIRQRYLVPAVFQKLSVIEKLLVADSLSGIFDTKRICDDVIDEIESTGRDDGCGLSKLFDCVVSQGSTRPDQKSAKPTRAPPDISARPKNTGTATVTPCNATFRCIAYLRAISKRKSRGIII